MPPSELSLDSIDPLQSPLLDSLNTYVNHFTAGSNTNELKTLILDAMAQEQRSSIYATIATNIWDQYSVVDVDLIILILRRWVSIDPESREARRALGSYLLAHGPDWDQEGHKLLEN